MSSDPCGKTTASPFRITSGPFRSRIIGPSPSIPVNHGFLCRFYIRNFTKNASSHRSIRKQLFFLFTLHKGIKNITVEWRPRKHGFVEFYFNHTPISRSSDWRHVWDAQVQAPELPVVHFSGPNLFLMPHDVRETILPRHLIWSWTRFHYSNYQVRTILWHNRWSGAVPHVSNRMKRSNLQKKDKAYSVLGCVGCAGERISLGCRQVKSKVPKIMKNLLVLQFCSWNGSFRHGEMKIWLCLYFQHVTRYIGTGFVEESRQKMQRSEEEHFFREGWCDRKEYISNAANKRCSRQVLQLRCSS